LQESNVLTPNELILLVKTSGFYDKHLILSHFKDPFLPYLTSEIRSNIAQIVKKKENIDAVWYTLLGLYVYT